MLSKEDLLKGLNDSQKEAVTSIDGAIQINATAGSGKTTVLTKRIAYMLQKGIKPSNIMCTTFTKKASEEMKTRLSTLIPKMALAQITLGTSHSIGYRILKKEYDNINHHLAKAFRKPMLINGSLKVFAENVKNSIIKDRTIPFELKEVLRDISTARLMKVVSTAKNNKISPYQFEQENYSKGATMEAYIEYYKKYEQDKWAQCCIDADDLLYLLIDLFEEHPDILQKYRGLYKYLLIDEGQDNNTLQYRMIKLLGEPENNIFLVGDDDQCIYSFRGSRSDEFIHFKDNYRGVQQINMEDNYRSNPEILSVANTLVKHNTIRLPKQMKANKIGSNANCVFYSSYDTEEDEAKGAVDEISNLVLNEGYKAQQICILYRTNAQSRAFEDELILSGLPYVIHGDISFYERREVKDLVAYLQLAYDKDNDEAFKRVINTPSRYLGKAFIAKVKSYNGSHMEAIQGNIYLKNYEKQGVTQFINLVEALSKLLENNTKLSSLVDYILDEGGYKAYILGDSDEDEEDNDRLANIETLKYVLDRYKNLEDFLEYISKMTSSSKHSIEGIQLMTIHKSKGLEFPATFVVGISEGLLPHFKSLEAVNKGKPLAVEEERRLLYVAITRAESTLYLSSVKQFNGGTNKPSRFIKEMNLKYNTK